MRSILYCIPILILTSGCIGDDIIQDTVDPEIRIQNQIDSLTTGNMHQFEAIYLNNVGLEEEVNFSWSSSDATVLEIDDTGLADALAPGITTVRAEAANISEAFQVIVSEEEVTNTGGNMSRTGTIRTTSSYVLEGTFSLSTIGTDLILQIDENYQASSTLPGLYLYLTNNPNTTNGAFEIGEVETFTGAHSYDISGVELNEFSHLLYYCKPFGVKVGDGAFDN